MKTAQTFYTLDIGSSELKLVEWSMRYGRILEMVNIRRVEVPVDIAYSYQEDQKISEWKKALTAFLKDERPGVQKKIAVGLPGDMTFTRYITLPNIPLSKISRIIRFEAEQQIPFLLSDVEWAYDVLPASGKKEVSLVIAAAKKKFVTELISLLPLFNFVIESLEVGQLALYNLAHHYAFDRSGTILIDIGTHNTNVVFVYKNITWGRTLGQGTSRITRMFAEKFSLDINHAAKKVAACRSGEDDAHMPSSEEMESITTLRNEVFYDISNEVSRTIAYFCGTHHGAEFKKILLVGGGSYLRGSGLLLEKNLGIKTTVADLSQQVRIAPACKANISGELNSYAVAIGIACGYHTRGALSANVLSEAYLHTRLIERKKTQFHFCFLAALIILLTIALNFHYELILKKSIVASYSEHRAYIVEAEKRLAPRYESIREKVNMLSLVSERMKERAFLPRMLKNIERVLPGTIWFDYIDYDAKKKTMILSGRATETLGEIEDFAARLRTIDGLRNATVNVGNIEEGTKTDAPLRIFTIDIDFEKE